MSKTPDAEPELTRPTAFHARTSALTRSLVDYRGIDPYSLRPQLADSWQETGSTLTIKLRSGVTFHNGQELTSQDVLANIVAGWMGL